jgi:hypothetical protein
MSTVEYQLLTRLEQVKARVRDVRTRAGLVATTPVLDRVTNMIQQVQARRAAGGLLRGGLLGGAAAPPATPPATQVEQYGFLETQEEELGIEAR